MTMRFLPPAWAWPALLAGLFATTFTAALLVAALVWERPIWLIALSSFCFGSSVTTFVWGLYYVWRER